MITSNATFGNNILRNMELSYSIIGYITNQYLFRQIFNTTKNFTINNVEDIIKKNSINDFSNNAYPIPHESYTQKVTKSNYSHFLQETLESLIDEKNILIIDRLLLDDALPKKGRDHRIVSS